MLRALAGLTSRRPWWVLLGGLVLAAGAGWFGAPVVTALHGGSADFSTPGSESVRADARIERATGIRSDGGLLALVRLDAPVEDPSSRARVGRVAAAMRAQPALARVQTYYDTSDAALLSRDGRATVVRGLLHAGSEPATTVAALAEAFEDEPAVSLGGSAAVDEQVTTAVHEDLARAELLAFPVLLVLSLWVFRSLVAATLPLVIGGLNLVFTLLGLRIFASLTDLSVFALNLVTALGLGLAIDYSLLLVSRFRSELAARGDVDAAVTVTLRTAGKTIVFSSLTVAAALASLLVFGQRFLYSMAVGGVMVSLLSAVVALVLLPAMLRLLGRHVDSLAPARWRRTLEDAESRDGGWFRVARQVMRRPSLVAVGAAVLLVALGLPFLGVRFTFIGPADLPAGASSRQVDEVLHTRFPSNPRETTQVVVSAPAVAEPEVAHLRSRILELPEAAGVSPAQQLDDSTWLLQVTSHEDPLAGSSQELVRQVRALPVAQPVLVGGETARFVDLKASIAAQLPLAVLLVCLTNIVVLGLMTASVVLPVKAVLMNLLTLAATFGLLTVIFQHGHLGWLFGHSAQGALETTQPVLLFALVFGLSTDYGVFLLARIKEARDAGAGDREAVVLGVGRTGRIVTAAAVLFCVALGALATSRIVFIKELGVGTAAGVLIDATIVRALLVPSLMALLGSWNWWAPAWLRRLHERLGLAEGGDVAVAPAPPPGPVARPVPRPARPVVVRVARQPYQGRHRRPPHRTAEQRVPVSTG